MRLTKRDYSKILKFYKKNKTKKNKKKVAEGILAQKMCSCIQKVKRKDRFLICNRSIFTNRNLKIDRVKCKKSPTLAKNNKTKRRLSKTKRNIF